MADDHFGATAPTITGPAMGAFVVAPDDANDLPNPIRAVTINNPGTISYISSRDNTTNTTGVLPVGTYTFFADRILATNTTATDITGWI